MNNVLEVKNVKKSYGKHLVLKDINLSLKSEEILGIVGKNGAGKTTLLKTICGMIAPTSGEIIKANNITIGSLIEEPGVCMDMTAFENIKMKTLAIGNIQNHEIEDVLTLVGLEKKNKLPVKNYSLGMKQRLGIALAVIGTSDIIVLDEPINGLDPQGIVEIRDLILKLKNQYHKTVLVSSHILDELFKICDQYIIIDQGEIKSYLDHYTLNKMLDGNIELMVKEIEQACSILKQNGIKNFDIVEEKIFVDKTTISISNLAKLVIENDLTLEHIGYHKMPYEKIFLNLINRKEKIKNA